MKLATRLRTHVCGDVDERLVGSTVTLCGWVHRSRDHGGMIFVDLRDRWGIVQLVFPGASQGGNTAARDAAKELRGESAVRVTGEVVKRAAGTENPKMATGRVEVVARELTVLNDAPSELPFQMEEMGVSEEVRLKYRYLDLRRARHQDTFALRSRTALAARMFLASQGFQEIETPMLVKRTPEGARDYLVPSRVHPGQFYALPQSPQLYKQLLMISGLDRYFQIARCFRDEDLRADRQPEFTQIDIEASFVGPEDILGLTEGLLAALWREGGVEIQTPFPRMTYREAMERYGIDRPDLRYGLELFDASELFANSEFGIARQAISAGGRVRGLRVPGGAALSRKQVDELEAVAKSAGAGGVIRLKRAGETLEGPAAKFLAAGSAAALGLADGDLGLFVAGPDRVTSPVLDRVRQEVARRMGLVPEGERRFLWVTDFPMFDRAPSTGALASVHHPCTSPNPEDLGQLESAPEHVRALAYDVVLNGTELGGGSIRIADPRLQERVFQLLGIDEETAQARFGFLLEGLRAGAPPHGGIALGFDRIAMLLSGAASLRDVIAFPKTTAARALFEGAPAPVPEADLGELHISIDGARA
ncbi:MAG: aspartate--tRNA ligase [Candidatus Eiseniibacteriota bacterium]